MQVTHIASYGYISAWTNTALSHSPHRSPESTAIVPCRVVDLVPQDGSRTHTSPLPYRAVQCGVLMWDSERNQHHSWALNHSTRKDAFSTEIDYLINSQTICVECRTVRSDEMGGWVTLMTRICMREGFNSTGVRVIGRRK